MCIRWNPRTQTLLTYTFTELCMTARLHNPLSLIYTHVLLVDCSLEKKKTLRSNQIVSMDIPILCYFNAVSPVAHLVSAYDWHAKDPSSNPGWTSMSFVLYGTKFFTGHPHACLHLPNVQIGYTVRDGGIFMRKTLASTKHFGKLLVTFAYIERITEKRYGSQ